MTCLALGHDSPKLIVVMLDGCRHDYFSRIDPTTGGYAKIKHDGVIVDYVQPILPSLSWPSWTTIVTGLYPEDHQITGNHMQDPQTGQRFDPKNDSSVRDEKWWQGHIPIWSTLTAQGYKVGLHKWSRCDVPFMVNNQSVLPEKCLPYFSSNYSADINTFHEALVDSLYDIQNGILDASFVYYLNIDSLGHPYGPDSTEVKSAVWDVNQVLLEFLFDIEDRGLEDVVNVIILSDHGMTNNSYFDYEPLSSHLSDQSIEDIEVIIDGYNIGLKSDANLDSVYENLKEWEDIQVYKKDEMPEYFGLNEADFLLDLIVSPKSNVTGGIDNAHPDLYWPGFPTQDETLQKLGGSHGYNDITEGYSQEGQFPDMRGIFMAIGPKFEKGRQHQWIKLVDKYQVMLHVLDITDEIPQHNGTWDRVKCMFVDQKCESNNSQNVFKPFRLLVFVASFYFIGFL